MTTIFFLSFQESSFKKKKTVMCHIFFDVVILAAQCCGPPFDLLVLCCAHRFVFIVLFLFLLFVINYYYYFLSNHRGRVRTKTIKRSARKIIEKYYNRLTLDFDINKRVIDEVAVIPTKRMRNKIAGFLTHLMRRIQRGPVRGISLKLQEEEREKKLDYVPDVSFIEQDSIEVDQDTKDLLNHLNIDLPNVSVASNNYHSWKKAGKRSGGRR